MIGAKRLISKISAISARWIDRRIVRFQIDQPIVSITFDDFPRSALDKGGDILVRENVAGTFYTAFGLANAGSPVGFVGRIAELADCVRCGHEIGCHTYDHLDCGIATVRDIEESIARNQAVLRDIGLSPFKHFAYPFGTYSLGAKRTVMRHYVSARTSVSGINRGDIDLGLLKSIPLYSHVGPKGWNPYFRGLRCRTGWLILRTHDVSENPSAYGCTPDQLRLVIQRAREECAIILPVGAAIDKILAVRGSPATQ